MPCGLQQNANSPHSEKTMPRLRLPIDTCDECMTEGDAGPTVKQIKGHGAWDSVCVRAGGRVCMYASVQTEQIQVGNYQRNY